jgi:hypothetical protein
MGRWTEEKALSTPKSFRYLAVSVPALKQPGEVILEPTLSGTDGLRSGELIIAQIGNWMERKNWLTRE